MVRCKRCKLPYVPSNVSRIRTCVFCRKMLITDRKERVLNIVNDIKRYSETQGFAPTQDVVKTWIKFKFSIGENTCNSYLKELKNFESITFFEDEQEIRIGFINLVTPVKN